MYNKHKTYDVTDYLAGEDNTTEEKMLEWPVHLGDKWSDTAWENMTNNFTFYEYFAMEAQLIISNIFLDRW